VSTPIADPAAEGVLSDPAASTWLKGALRDSLERDPVDALNDVLALAGILEERLRRVFDLDDLV
jgi:hypothetical protein